MATVLLGWELGSGFGHVVPLVRLARDLAAQGHRPVLALKNLAQTWMAWRDLEFPVVPAPMFPPRPDPGGRSFLARSFGDILAIRGYTAVEDLLPLVTAWDNLIAQVRPKLIVADFSPTLQLAASGAVPFVGCGLPLAQPPLEGDDFPVLTPHAAAVAPAEQLLATVQEVQRRRGRPVPERLTDIARTERFVNCFSHLDPYQAVRREPCFGPLDPLPPRSPLPVQPSFFAYLNGDYPGTALGLAAMVRAGVPGQAFIRGVSAEGRHQVEQMGVQVHDRMVSLPELLPRISVVVHHGSLGLSHPALAAGRPQLLLPQHLEHMLTATRLEHLGVGLKLTGRIGTSAVTLTMQRLVADLSFADRAQVIACELEAAGPWTAHAQLLKRCLLLL